MNEDYYIMWLSSIKAINQITKDRLLNSFSSAEAIYNAPRNELLEKLDFDLADKVYKAAHDGSLDMAVKRLGRAKAKYVSRYNKDFPIGLKYIDDVPMGIYYKGRLPENGERIVTIAGARICSDYGKNVAYQVACDLAKCGIVTVSSMTEGVDTSSAMGSLEAGGKVVATMGTEIDKYYPAINKGLCDKIIDSGGCMISEYAPGESVGKWAFSKRNRINIKDEASCLQ